MIIYCYLICTSSKSNEFKHTLRGVKYHHSAKKLSFKYVHTISTIQTQMFCDIKTGHLMQHGKAI